MATWGMNKDPFNLSRFITAQEGIYEQALAELKCGRKETHWMWFIFPQIEGLGISATSKHYSIKSRHEAQEYLQHPVLGKRLVECSNALLHIHGKTALGIMGFPDDLKLHSCMTLFAAISQPGSIFHQIINKYFQGQPDQRTVDDLEGE